MPPVSEPVWGVVVQISPLIVGCRFQPSRKKKLKPKAVIHPSAFHTSKLCSSLLYSVISLPILFVLVWKCYLVLFLTFSDVTHERESKKNAAFGYHA